MQTSSRKTEEPIFQGGKISLAALLAVVGSLSKDHGNAED